MNDEYNAVWLLDLDGTMHVPPSNSSGVRNNYKKMQKMYPYWVNVCVGHHGDVCREDTDLMFAPYLVDFVNRMHQTGLAKVVFVTTWFETAVTQFAPAVGLDSTIEFAEVKGSESKWPVKDWWKYKTVASMLPNNFVWTDDDLRREHYQPLLNDARSKGFDGLGLAPASNRGLDMGHLEQIETFLTKCKER